MIDRNELAVVHDYEELRTALRARAEALDISRLEIDRISGVANGYSATVLSDTARKRIGANAIGPLLAALGLQLVVREDPEMVARFTSRCEKRVPNMAHTDRVRASTLKRLKPVIFAELGRKGGLAFWATKTEAERGEWGRQMIAKRWQQYRAKRARKVAPLPLRSNF